MRICVQTTWPPDICSLGRKCANNTIIDSTDEWNLNFEFEFEIDFFCKVNAVGVWKFLSFFRVSHLPNGVFAAIFLFFSAAMTWQLVCSPGPKTALAPATPPPPPFHNHFFYFQLPNCSTDWLRFIIPMKAETLRLCFLFHFFFFRFFTFTRENTQRNSLYLKVYIYLSNSKITSSSFIEINQWFKN